MKNSERQFDFNAKTRSNWDSFENHRNQTVTAICDAKKFLPLNRPESSIAILGCGNGNDLDLKRIAETYSRIHLIDFDPAALEYLKSQQLSDQALSDSVVIEPPVDLSGVAADLDDLPSGLTESRVAGLIEKTRMVKDVLPDRQFDVVVSTSILTQLLDSVVNSLGDDSDYKNAMMLAIRDGHVKLMADLIRPGGAGVLISDFVSSDTLPELAAADTPESVLTLARKAIDQRNFFTGTNPWAMRDALAKLIVEDPFEPWNIAPPWRWQIGTKRSYLVTAINFSKPPNP